MNDRKPLTPKDLEAHVADAFGREGGDGADSPELSAALASLGEDAPSEAGAAVKQPREIDRRLDDLELQVSLLINILDEVRRTLDDHVEHHRGLPRFVRTRRRS